VFPGVPISDLHFWLASRVVLASLASAAHVASSRR